MFPNQFGNKKGVSIIEILVVISIIVIALTSLLELVSFSLKISTLVKQTTQANLLAQETMEQGRNFRDGINWNNDDSNNQYDGLGVVSLGIAYHLEKSSDIPSKWMLITGEETIDSFTRKVVFENVMRDGNYNIVFSGGTNDPNTKKVTVTVSWQERGVIRQVKLVTYLTNWK